MDEKDFINVDEQGNLKGYGAMTDRELEQRFPSIAWREPILIEVGGERFFQCRYCIAQIGIKAKDRASWPRDKATVMRHIAEHHSG